MPFYEFLFINANKSWTVFCDEQLKRYKTYVRLLRVRTAAALRDTDARPVTTMIGELEAEPETPVNPMTASSPGITHRMMSRQTGTQPACS